MPTNSGSFLLAWNMMDLCQPSIIVSNHALLQCYHPKGPTSVIGCLSKTPDPSEYWQDLLTTKYARGALQNLQRPPKPLNIAKFGKLLQK